MVRIGYEDRDVFFGRDPELELLRSRAGKGAHLSLVGPSGSGKSRLAREASRRDDAIYLDLSWIEGDPMTTLIHALHSSVPESATEAERNDFLTEQLSEYSLIFVDAETAPLRELVSGSTTVVRCDGQPEGDVIELGPLEVESARSLLLDRIRRRDPGFSQVEENEVMDALLELADFQPRAIESLARELMIFAPEELLELRRDAAFRPTEKHGRSWRDVFDRLDETHRRVCAAASHFPAGFDVKQLAKVLSMPLSRCAHVVETLVEETLLRRIDPRGSTRARFKIESSAALEFAENYGPYDEVESRIVISTGERGHRALRQLARDGAENELQAIREDEPNLVHAVELAREDHPREAAWMILALLQAAGTRWLRARRQSWAADAERLIEEVDDDELRVAMIFVKGEAAFLQRRYEEAVELLVQVERYKERGPLYWLSQIRLADALRMLYRYDEALERHRAVADEVSSEYRACLARAHIGIGWYHSTKLEYQNVRDEFSRAIALAKEVGAKRILTHARRGQIDASMVLGDFESARVHAEAIVQELSEFDAALRIANARLLLADILVQAHRLDDARAVLDTASQTYDEGEFARMRGYLEFSRAKISLLEFDYEKTLEHIAAARDWFADDPAAFLLEILEEFASVCINPESIRPAKHDEWIEIAEDYWEAAGVSARLFMLACRQIANAPRDDDDEALHQVLARARDAGMAAHVSAARILAGERVKPIGLDAHLFAGVLEQDAGRTLKVGPAGHWFEVEGTRVEIGNRKALPALLLALATNDEGALESYDLARVGWPDEELHPDTATNRVYVAIHALRKLGLTDYLTTQGRGYMLHPDVTIELVDG